MIDQKTSFWQLPLPHPGNLLQEDVGRLRTAFNNLDGLVWLQHQGLERLIPAETAALTYTVTGQVATLTETLRGGTVRTTAYAYDADGRLVTETVDVANIRRVTTYSYDLNRRLLGWNTTETPL
jgi:YD repeat-containing protein